MTATKIQPGDDTHLTLLMAPHSLNFVTGADRAALLAYGRDVFAAARDSKCLAQIEEPAQPVCWIRFCSDGSTEGPIMHSQICEARKTSGAWTPLYAGAAPAAVAGPAWDKTRHDLAIVMMGFAGNPSRSLEVAEIVLDAATEPGAPMAYLRGAPAAPALEAPAAPATPVLHDIDAGIEVMARLRENRAPHSIYSKMSACLFGDPDKPRAALAAAPQAPAAPAEPHGLVKACEAVIAEWSRQKGLFPVLSRDGWMDECVAELRLAIQAEPAAPSGVVGDMAALVKQLVQALRKAAPNHVLPAKALDYLRRQGLQGSPLRAAPAAPAVDAQGERDAAFEAVRQRLCRIPRWSFHIDSRGNIRRVDDARGNWIEFSAAHELLDPVAVDAAIAAQAAAKGE